MKKLLGISFVTLLLGLLVACDTSSAPSPAPAGVTAAATTTAAYPVAGKPTIVRTGYVPVLISAPYYIAMEKGYFKELGLDVQMQPLQGGSDAVIQLSSGSFDVAAGGAGVGFWNAVDRGVKFVVVAPLHTETSHQATPLVTSKANFDSGKVKKAADLKGQEGRRQCQRLGD